MRKSVRNTLAFLALGGLGWLLGNAFESRGMASAGEMVRSAAVVAMGLALIRFTGLAIFRLLIPVTGAKVPRIIEELLLLLAYVGWGMLHLRLWGMDLGSLVTTSAVITAVAAFAMQDTLGNVLGGLFLELDRSIAIGDWIRLDELSGRVTEITWRHTAIRTRNGDTVVVPNSVLMKSRFSVIGNPGSDPVRWRRWIWFEVDLDTPAAAVIAAAEQALAGAEVPNVARAPAPGCVLMEILQGRGRYALRYWLSDPDPDDGTDSAVRVHLLAALERAGLRISLPKEVRYEVLVSTEQRNARREKDLEKRVAALRSVDLFAPLSDGELRAVAERLVHAPFAAGDVVTRQGAIAHWLYLLARGEAEVWVEAAGAPARLVSTVGAGQVFGEMGMMTGEPRRATVRARTDLDCYRLDKTGFEAVLRTRPSLAGLMSRILVARAEGLAQTVERAQADAAPRISHETVLDRILAFFSLESAAEGPRKAA